MEIEKKFMRKAIELSLNNIKKGGGPFGAVIVRWENHCHRVNRYSQ